MTPEPDEEIPPDVKALMDEDPTLSIEGAYLRAEANGGGDVIDSVSAEDDSKL